MYPVNDIIEKIRALTTSKIKMINLLKKLLHRKHQLPVLKVHLIQNYQIMKKLKINLKTEEK